MTALPPPIDAYVRAYNAMDVDAMLACLTDDVRFRNVANGAVTAETSNKADFAALARLGAAAFSSRRQTPTSAITVAETTIVEIAFTAVVSADPPHGWSAGQELSFAGASCFVLRGDLIASIVDESAG